MIPTDFPAPDDLSKQIIFSFIFPLPRRKYFFSIKRWLHGNTSQWSMKWDKERNSLLLTQIKIYLEPSWVYPLSNSHFTKRRGSDVILTWVCMCINSFYWKESKLFIYVSQLLQWHNLMEMYPLLFGKHPHFRGGWDYFCTIRIWLGSVGMLLISVKRPSIYKFVSKYISHHLLWWRKQNCVMPGIFGQHPKKTLSHVPVWSQKELSWHKQEMEQSWEGAARHEHGTVYAGRANKARALTNYSFSWIFGLLWFSPEPLQRMRHL